MNQFHRGCPGPPRKGKLRYMLAQQWSGKHPEIGWQGGTRKTPYHSHLTISLISAGPVHKHSQGLNVGRTFKKSRRVGLWQAGGSDVHA